MAHNERRPTTSRLRVILAGYNGDVEALRDGEGSFSPETLAAAYARISRHPDPVPDLRRKAREEVDRARRSNRTIVFGLGHHSVAEHAVFNFDILHCSRLAIEALEWHRLCSYTEKSQRYITLDGDHVEPAEMDPGELTLLEETIEAQNQHYHRLLPLLHERQKALHPEMLESRQDRGVLEGWAKEDARYVVSLATEGQLGFTCNARNLELIVRRMRRARLEEVRRLGGLLYDRAHEVAPSLIVLADEETFRQAYGATLRDDYFREGESDLVEAAAAVPVPETAGESLEGVRHAGDVSLLGHTPDPDGAVISSLLFAAGRGSLHTCCEAARRMTRENRLDFVRGILAHLSEFDTLPRAFEEAVFRLEMVIDASALAQLKRHRMSTQQWGPYDPELGFTVPPEIEEIGEAPAFNALMERTAQAHMRLATSLEQRGTPRDAATYVLANATRRRVTVTMNLREVYHFSRLREDRHAQWAIRRIATDVSSLVREAAPVTSLLLGGKDRYSEVFTRAMGRTET